MPLQDNVAVVQRLSKLSLGPLGIQLRSNVVAEEIDEGLPSVGKMNLVSNGNDLMIVELG